MKGPLRDRNVPCPSQSHRYPDYYPNANEDRCPDFKKCSKATNSRKKAASQTFTPLPLSYRERGRMTDTPNVDDKDDIKPSEPKDPRPTMPSIIVDPVSSHRRYKVGQFLGKGGFAWVFQIHDINSGETLACKIIPKDRFVKPHHREKVVREIRIHYGCVHEEVVRLISAFEDTVNIYIVLELCHMKSLVNVLNARSKLTEPEVRYYIYGLLMALDYLHTVQNVLHRDIKLGNLLITSDMKLKLCDFGLAIDMQEGENVSDGSVSLCGTPNYISPEVLRKEGHSVWSEMWAVGCTMFAMLDGRPPFETRTLEETYSLIAKVKYRLPVNISDSARNLLQLLLHPRPECRPTALSALQHAFFSPQLLPIALHPSLSANQPRNGDIVYSNVQEQTRSFDYPTQMPISIDPRSFASYRNLGSNNVSPYELSPCVTPPCTVSYSTHFYTPYNVHQSHVIQNSGLNYNAGICNPNYAPQTCTYGMPTLPASSRPPTTIPYPVNPMSPSFLPIENNQPQVYRFAMEPSPPPFSPYPPPVEKAPLALPEPGPVYLTRVNSGDGPPSLTPPFIDLASSSGSGDSGLGSERARQLFDKVAFFPPIMPDASSTHKELRMPPAVPVNEVFCHTAVMPQTPLIVDMLRRLKSFDSNLFVTSPRSSCKATECSTLVTKWVDYTNKFGFGCVFSDGTCSVSLDDGTKISLSPDRRSVQYINGATRSMFSVSSIPSFMQKKVDTLTFFERFMSEKLDHGCVVEKGSTKELPYLTHSYRNANAAVFLLSTGNMQVNFCDTHCKISLHVVPSFMLMQSHRVAMEVTFVDSARHLHKLTLTLLHHYAQDPFLLPASEGIGSNVKNALLNTYDVIREQRFDSNPSTNHILSTQI